MKFLFQNNLLSEVWLDKVRRLGNVYPSQYVTAIPFERELTSPEPIEGLDYIPYGSCNMTNICIEKGYKGISFDEKTFSYEEYSKNTKTLNQGIVLTLIDAIDFFKKNDGLWFAKPNKDDKKFTGSVQHSEYYFRMLEDMYRYKDSPGTYGIDETFEVFISKPLDIQMEVRWFVIDGKVIDGSMYRFKGILQKENVTKEPDMLEEAQKFADIWLPHQNVVMDLGLVDGELSVVEFNCINSSGFYDHNTDAVFKAWWEFHNK